jgi:hypothetical protein
MNQDATASATPGHAGEHGHGEHPPHLAHHFDTPEQQFDSAKLGMWIFLATEILMFGGLFCAYSIYRGNNPEIFTYSHAFLDTTLGAINTVILIASSFTMAWAVRASQLSQRRLMLWLLIATFLGGCGFMGIKAVEYYEKFDHDLWPGQWNVFYPADQHPEFSQASDPQAAQLEAIHHLAAMARGVTVRGMKEIPRPMAGKARRQEEAAPLLPSSPSPRPAANSSISRTSSCPD